jgi:hypothetical protein
MFLQVVRGNLDIRVSERLADIGNLRALIMHRDGERMARCVELRRAQVLLTNVAQCAYPDSLPFVPIENDTHTGASPGRVSSCPG